ncbi:MAG TPA: DUF4349 domain-containing protein [Polyangiaceae bacterium]
MRAWSMLVLGGVMIAGCHGAKEEAPPAAERVTVGAPAPLAAASAATSNGPSGAPLDGRATARKVMRKADLTLEVRTPAQAETEVTSIAERAGGYVASSAREVRAEEGAHALSRVTLTLRVPSDKLGSVLADVKRLGIGSATENITSDDVTDEYIDLEARLKNQRAMEEQFRELLKRASSVEDALKVEQQLGSVRTEIDRMEGRRRFIDQESAFSTVTLTLSEARPLVAATPSGLRVSVREAVSDSLELAAGLLTGAIRLTGVLLPLALLLGLPLALALRWLRRVRRARLAEISG